MGCLVNLELYSMGGVGLCTGICWVRSYPTGIMWNFYFYFFALFSLLTLSVHAREGYSSQFVCLSVSI